MTSNIMTETEFQKTLALNQNQEFISNFFGLYKDYATVWEQKDYSGVIVCKEKISDNFYKFCNSAGIITLDEALVFLRVCKTQCYTKSESYNEIFPSLEISIIAGLLIAIVTYFLVDAEFMIDSAFVAGMAFLAVMTVLGIITVREVWKMRTKVETTIKKFSVLKEFLTDCENDIIEKNKNT